MASYQPTTYQNGAQLVQYAINTAKRGDVNAVSISSIATVLTPSSGKRFVLLGGYISMSASASVLFEDNASGTTVFRTPLLLANSPFYFDIGRPYVSAAVDNVLKATSSAAGSITGTLFYVEI
jgi:hypothetical protein